MMEREGSWFGGDGFGPLVERCEAGDLVTICHQGLPVLTYERTDPIARDLVIASLLRLGLLGKTVARLGRMSEAHVSGVATRLDAGGTAALRVRSKPGPAFTITGRALEKLRALRTPGASLDRIAKALARPKSTVARAVRALVKAPPVPSQIPLLVYEEATGPSATATVPDDEGPTLRWGEQEWAPGALVPASDVAHPTRYAGTLLLCAAADAIGVHDAVTEAVIRRPETAVYTARQATVARLRAWSAGLGSLEAMHERDAAALGVVLGLERSPSVRTLHRAVRQRAATVDPVSWGAARMRGLQRAMPRAALVFGVDGHLAPYKGPAPIDRRAVSARHAGRIRACVTQAAWWSNATAPRACPRPRTCRHWWMQPRR
jgi:hypothetical protein